MTAAVQPPATREQHRGHLRIAERIVACHGNRIRHVHGVGWHLWDGTRWRPDVDGAATRAAVDVVKAAYRDLPDLDRDTARELLADIHRCESAGGLTGALSIAGDLLPIALSVDRLDPDPFLLNTASGTLDLRTGQVRPHDPADLITKITGCGYDPDARSDAFDRFLTEVLPDPAVRQFAARVFGQALEGRVVEHLLPVFDGAGQNGKTTLVDTAAAAYGEYAIAAEPDLLVERGSVHTTGQADLLGVRLAVCSETDDGRRLAAATVKRLTGGDKVRARRMRQDNIEFPASHSVLLVTNHKPKVAGDDPALWRRIRIVPFNVTVQHPDPRLKERLTLQLPAVLAWIVAGHHDWKTNGMADPDAVTQATDAYQNVSDDLGRFIEERCIQTGRAGTVRARQLFTAWSDWCHRNGEHAGTEVTFAEAVRRRGHEKIKRNGIMTYLGLMLTDDDDHETPA